jgi:hypothetical protein
MHFHATWREFADQVTQTNAGADHGAFDVNFVTVRGAGVYAGDVLTVYNGAAGWWGEGDEKVYVDGEAFPSHIGTGSEDYYGYAWCCATPFTAPFHAQPAGAGNGQVDLSVNARWRSLDAIPFTSGLKFDMELWHWKRTRVHYAPTTFWYARPGATCNVAPAPAAAAHAVKEPPAPVQPDAAGPAFKIEGALEGEALKVAEVTGGETALQEWKTPIWSGNQQLWWTHPAPGNRLVLEVPVAQAGRYELSAILTLAKDYGIVKVAINGQVLNERLDLYNEGVITRSVKLGTAALPAGTAKLEITVIGANPGALPAHMFGLDCLKLTAAP